MKSALVHLLESENAKEILAFLRGRGPRACIIAPAWVRKRAIGEKPSGPEFHSATWSEVEVDTARKRQGASNYIVVAEDAERERAIVSSLGHGGDIKIFGLFGHVLPALLCSMNGMAAGVPAADLKRYAILCVPRSGSRYLSAVLSTRGVGAPREHIREPFARIIADGKLGFSNAVAALERFGQKNRIFGTKLISTFLIHASNRELSEVTSNVTWMVERGYQLVRLERPINETVISSYIAYLMRSWHIFQKLDEGARAKLDALQFDEGAAWSEFIRFRAEQLVIDALAGQFDIPKIAYSDIESDVDGVVSGICSRIGVQPVVLEAGSARIPIPIRSESRTYETFGERLTALLDRRAADIDLATVRKLRAIAKVPQKAAEDMIAGNA